MLGMAGPTWGAVLTTIGVMSGIYAVITSIRLRRAKSESAPSVDAIPISKFYGQAKRFGWDFHPSTGHMFDMVDGLKHAGAVGSIRFWGTYLDGLPGMENGGIRKIPEEFWVEGEISASSPFDLDDKGQVIGIAQDNRKIETKNHISRGYRKENYCNIHVDEMQSIRWLETKGNDWMGKAKRELGR